MAMSPQPLPSMSGGAQPAPLTSTAIPSAYASMLQQYGFGGNQQSQMGNMLGQMSWGGPGSEQGQARPQKRRPGENSMAGERSHGQRGGEMGGGRMGGNMGGPMMGGPMMMPRFPSMPYNDMPWGPTGMPTSGWQPGMQTMQIPGMQAPQQQPMQPTFMPPYGSW